MPANAPLEEIASGVITVAQKPTLLIVGAGRVGAELAARLVHTWRVIIVDETPQALESELLAECEPYLGDATSPIVLKQAGIDQAQIVVATTASDERNFEVVRVARERFGIEKRFALLGNESWIPRFDAEGVELLNRAHACALQLETRIRGGQKVAANIGLGAGEIMEIEVLGNSPVIGERLRDLRPRRWLVGAIYRNGRLIVPHGHTRIEKGDRIVIIGDPKILPAIATHVGIGESEFPLHYGSALGTLGSHGLQTIGPELQYLLAHTAASTIKVLHGTQHLPQQFAENLDETIRASMGTEDVGTDEWRQLARASAERDIGLVVLPPRPLALVHRIGLFRSPYARMIDELRAPALIARNTVPYTDILLVLAQLPFHHETTRVAIDLARMVNAHLHLAVVHQPAIVVGTERRNETAEQRRQIIAMAQMYRISVNVVELEGNPIEEIMKHCHPYQLLVLPHRRGRGGSITHPDISDYLAHRVPRSVLLVPHD